MHGKTHFIATAALALWLSVAPTADAAELRVAVAANFTAAMQTLAERFQQLSGHRLRVSYGSTGKLYAQILQGAPFDVFLAADQRRPRLLQQQGLASGRFTYATGRLVLWSARQAGATSPGEHTLTEARFHKLALANPKTAPYGAAAVSVMRKLGVERRLRDKRVTGESVAQAYQFVASGNADLGFVALAQVALDDSGSYWLIPQALYPPIHQDAVVLKRGDAKPAATEFLAYLRSRAARDVIARYGYGTD